MQYGTIAAIYFIVWWITLFAVLPLGVRAREDGDEIAAGTDPGAPVEPRLVRKALITTVLAVPGAALVYWLIRLA